MTRLDRAKELHPEIINEEIFLCGCPEDYLDQGPKTVCKDGVTCEQCWNVEYKGGGEA